MADVVFLAVLFGFFAVAAVLVRVCERVVGAAHPAAVADVVPEPPEVGT